MKGAYTSRLAWQELLCAINSLATRLHTWNRECDKQLQHLVEYVYHICSDALVGFIGDPLHKCRLELFTDADSAGDIRDSRSISGVFLTSQSSTEAELIGCNFWCEN